ncbi:hypothetical protein SGLAD_v1c01490 [Spiroplasma gladiatoris]|uniref:Uncharacterized protein n=1 Tax=Spiroplasma gladiatoris TaxID=2143 RepID=A0A4P7AI23_9MOLU|nr:hypothetical protein [Spiroplasma gladiatoris]QBQ07348.1 hypothetical protein SGLAD_v1c01490 [Spiroplasma gladiatoris]
MYTSLEAKNLENTYISEINFDYSAKGWKISYKLMIDLNGNNTYDENEKSNESENSGLEY